MTNITAKADLNAMREAMAGTAIGATLLANWDHDDPWGSAMSEAFGVCDYLWWARHMGNAIPESLAYRPGLAPDVPNPAFEALGWMPTFLLTRAALVAHLEGVTAIMDAAVAAGLDY